MNYLIVQDWLSTSGNHTGMVHMCNLLVKKYPLEYTVLVKNVPKRFSSTNNFFLRKLVGLQVKFYKHIMFPYEYEDLCKDMFSKLQCGDKVFLLEYMFPFVPQLYLAKYLKRKYPNIKIYGLCHLSPTFFKKKNIYPTLIRKWPRYVDKILTFGSSLTKYFENNGLDKIQISTGLHYVDNNYYHIDLLKDCSNCQLKAIVMGSMQRNFELLIDMVRQTPYISWVICQGRQKMDAMFDGLQNVEIKGFLEEDELRDLMSNADVSVNIMADTIGSNVITTSLAMGNAMVVSNVGSIRDYCDESNCIFCNNTVEDFVNAMNMLEKNRDKVMDMKRASLLKSQTLYIENIHEWFTNL